MIRCEVPAQPSETVTLVFTDVEASTRLLAELGSTRGRWRRPTIYPIRV